MYVHNRVSKSTLKELSQPNQQLEGTMKSIPPPAEPEDLSSAVEECLCGDTALGETAILVKLR